MEALDEERRPARDGVQEPHPTRADQPGLLTRVSTAKQGSEGISLDEQRQLGDAWAGRHDVTFAKQYERVGSGGASWLKRRDLQEIVQDARDGVIDVLVVCSVDRLSRDVPIFWKLYNELAETGCGLVVLGLGEDLDTKTAEGRALLGMLAHAGDMQRDAIRKSSARIHAYRKSQGLDVGGRPAVGFSRSGVIDPVEVQLVARMYRDADRGLSARKIAKALAEDYIRDRDGRPYAHFRVDDILRQERYGGYVLHEGRLIEAQWAAEMEQYIPRVLWQRVRDDRARRAHPQRRRSGRVPAQHLMAANGPPLIDARTGQRLHARSERDTYRPEGGGLNVKRPYADMVVGRAVMEGLKSLDDDIERLVESAHEIEGDVLTEIAYAERALAHSEVGLQKIGWLAESDDPRDRDDYRRRRDDLLEQRQAGHAQLERLRERLAAVQHVRDDDEIRERMRERLTNLTHLLLQGLAPGSDVAQLRAVCARVIDRVLVHPPDWTPASGVLDGDYFVPAGRGGCVLEIVWRDPDGYQPPMWDLDPSAGPSGGKCVQRPPSIVATT